MRGDSPLAERVRYYARRVRAWARRATATALAVRVTIWLAGAGALLTAAPPGLDPVGMVVLTVVLASLAAGFPNSFWVGALGFAVVVVLVISVGQGVTTLPVVALVAALLYVHHTMAALGAQVRTDALLPAAVIRRWAGRTAAVLGLSVVVGIGVVVLPTVQPGWSQNAHVGVGALTAVGVVAALAYLLLRRPEST